MPCLDGWDVDERDPEKRKQGRATMPPPSAALWNMLVGRWVVLGGGAVWEQQAVAGAGCGCVHQRPLQAAALLFGQEECCASAP